MIASNDSLKALQAAELETIVDPVYRQFHKSISANAQTVIVDSIKTGVPADIVQNCLALEILNLTITFLGNETHQFKHLEEEERALKTEARIQEFFNWLRKGIESQEPPVIMTIDIKR